MRIAIVGLGGIGGYFGGRLALHYSPGGEHEVIFVCRGEHLQAIRPHGLKVEAQDGDFVAVPSGATDAPDSIDPVDVAFYCVKGYDLASAARSMVPATTSETVSIPLGNGVDNDEVLRRTLGAGRALNGCVYISSHIEAPGFVQQTGGARKLLFGAYGDIESFRGIETLLKSAGMDATLTPDIQRAVWQKFVFIDASCGVTSLHKASVGEVLADESMKTQLRTLMQEVVDLARTRGVTLADTAVDDALATAGSFPPATKTSMQLDFERGNRTELEVMLGFVVRTAREAGIVTPAHDEVYAALSSRSRTP